jgi:hypothetical protein
MAIATIGHIFRSRTQKNLEIVAVMVLSERESLAENNNNIHLFKLANNTTSASFF